MYGRIVRFTDVDADHLESLLGRVESGPPEGARASAVQIYHDPDQRTAVVVQHYESAEDMSAGEAVFAAMDASETPGTRSTVDRCELRT